MLRCSPPGRVAGKNGMPQLSYRNGTNSIEREFNTIDIMENDNEQV
jgi:hypothetical protein